MSQNVTELNRWVVTDNTANIIERFSTQIKAIDFANREQKLHQTIVLIDITRCAIQLIARNDVEEKVG